MFSYSYDNGYEGSIQDAVRAIDGETESSLRVREGSSGSGTYRQT